MPRLVVRDLRKSFPIRGGTRNSPSPELLEILRGISLELSDGQNAAIVGPSGSGKSTLLHILGTLDSPTSGQVELDGLSPFSLPQRELAQFRNRQVGFIFQDHHLLPQLSVLENVLIPAMAEGAPSPERVALAADLATRVGLASRLDHRPAELSGGERQRAAVARALVMQPKLLLADEPTGNLDRTNARAIGELLLEMQAASGALLVAVTHSSELASQFQRSWVLDGGLLAET